MRWFVDQARIRDALIIVRATLFPAPEQLAARHLASCGRFIREPGNRYTLGRPASLELPSS